MSPAVLTAVSPQAPSRGCRAEVVGSLLLLVAVCVAASEPLAWLLASWQRPDGAATGWLIALGVAGLFAWSASSPLSTSRPASPGLPLVLLFVSLAVRLGGQLLAVNVLSAVMLAVDVYALAKLMRLDARRRAVDPLLLAGLFCFALPLEAVVQRTLGFGLQQLSAWLACSLLDLGLPVACEDTRIRLGAVDLLVDLPCSGARLLTQIGALFFAIHALGRPHLNRASSWSWLLRGMVHALLIAIAGNTLRICLLAMGLVLELPVMREPWHSMIGLMVLMVAAWTILRRAQGSATINRAAAVVPQAGAATAYRKASSDQRPRVTLTAGASALAAALLIVGAPGFPVDVSAAITPPALPVRLAGAQLAPLPITAQEARYFAAYGGSAARGRYGERALLLVRTTSPLRHLHAPDVCYTGAGYDVSFVGTDHESGAAVYRMRKTGGIDLRVRVSFLGSGGQLATSVSEAVWLWLTQPGAQTWTMVQAIEPWHKPSPGWRAAVERALEIGAPSPAPLASRPRVAITTSKEHHHV